MIKKVLYTLALALMCSAAMTMRAQDADRLFPYPVVPEDTEMSLSQRCNFLVYSFWDRCNIKESFSSLNKLNDAFGTWLSFMPYATADTVHLAIDNYIAAVEKAAPKQMIEVAKMAERWLHSDSAAYSSEEIYEPFCEAVVRNKKVPAAEKARYKAQLTVLQSSGLGKRVPDLKFKKPDGSTGSLDEVIASRVIIFFNDPDCIDCIMAKARLSADYNLNQLIDRGLVKLVSIYPGEASDQWKKEAATYPDNWIVGAMDDADLYFSLGELPELYYLDGRHKVLGKNVDLDGLLYTIAGIYTQQTQASPQ